MLSYRHAFHAGNHADVLKHVVLLQLLRYMGRKDKAFWYIDTHAGAGAYLLTDGHAAQNAEYESGISRLFARTDLPPAVADYVAAVRALNTDGKLRHYPGSPYLAWECLRERDRVRLFEMHPTESNVLRENFRDAGRRAMVFDSDGFTGIRAILPPTTRRAVTLIDPSYEDKRDYARALETLEDSLKRFADGTYALWYPQVVRPEVKRLPQQLKALQRKGWVHATLNVCAPPADGIGLFGSSVFVLNPPFVLHDILRETLPYLAQVLGQDASAGFALEYSTA